jgi:LysM repeat protein
MNKPTFLLLPFASLLFASCSKDASENYDTPPTTAYDAPAPVAPNPTYESAAYEDTSATPQPAVDPAAPTPAQPANVTSTVGALSHYVAPGDSLWKISRQYNIPVDSIKAANNMTTDTVVLGKKLIIPAK